MGFLTGKTAIITGAGRAVLEDEVVVLLVMELRQLMLKKELILSLQDVMLKN